MIFGNLSGLLNIFSSGKQRFLGGSLILAIAGFFWQGSGDQPAIYRDDQAREVTTISEYARGSSDNERTSLRRTERTTGSLPIQDRMEELARRHPTWGNAAMRLGMSFFVALMIASLLKAFIKTMVTVLLVVGVSLYFMEQRGMIEPFWDHDMGFLISAKDWLAAQTDTVVGFLKGYLPSTGAASAGFFMGMRK